MNHRRYSRIARLVCCITVIACFLPHSVIACAMLTQGPTPEPIFVSAERAVIIWDQAHHIEHFIRQASIATKDADIGFLVPTPETPELAQADNHIFDLTTSMGGPTMIPPTNEHSLWSLVSPVVISSYLRLDRLSPQALFTGVHELEPGANNLAVLAEHDVAGYHATILAADDESLLAGWLPGWLPCDSGTQRVTEALYRTKVEDHGVQID